jgi:hypothetical protein
LNIGGAPPAASIVALTIPPPPPSEAARTFIRAPLATALNAATQTTCT